MHTWDWINGVRRKVQPTLHSLLSEIGLYASTDSGSEEYACTVYDDVDEVERQLEQMGFFRNPVAALKYRASDHGKQYSRGSWFYFAMEEPIDTWGIDLPKYQHHVTLYNHPKRKGVDLYVHKEYFWGTKPEDHYNAVDHKAIPAWLRMKFSDEGIDYEVRDIKYE